MPVQTKHFVRYGTHAEKNFFLGSFADDYDAIIINGNMLANSENAMSAFVFKVQKPFLIDPQTHAFQHDPKYITNGNGDIKSSIKKLAENFGSLITSGLVKGEAIKASDLTDIDEFVKLVIKFERDNIKTKILDSDDNEYITFEGSTFEENSLVPIGIISPYFYMDSYTISSWLPVNIRLVNKTKELVGADTIVFAEIVISKDILNNNILLNQIITAYLGSSCDKILIWIDSFAEENQDVASLNNLINFVKQLRVGGKEVYNLYGGYFSILLTANDNGLSGVSHGLEYGESRGVIPVGGGVPLVKYYFPPFHTRLRIEDLARILTLKGWQPGANNQEFASEVCDCPKCFNIGQFEETLPLKKVGRGIRRAFPTTAAKRHSLEHYLYCKQKEFQIVNSKTLKELAGDMRQTKVAYNNIVDEKLTQHLDNWSDAIEENQTT